MICANLASSSANDDNINVTTIICHIRSNKRPMDFCIHKTHTQTSLTSNKFRKEKIVRRNESIDTSKKINNAHIKLIHWFCRVPWLFFVASCFWGEVGSHAFATHDRIDKDDNRLDVFNYDKCAVIGLSWLSNERPIIIIIMSREYQEWMKFYTSCGNRWNTAGRDAWWEPEITKYLRIRVDSIVHSFLSYNNAVPCAQLATAKSRSTLAKHSHQTVKCIW